VIIKQRQYFAVLPQCFGNGNIRLVGGADRNEGESGGVYQWNVGNCVVAVVGTPEMQQSYANSLDT